MAIRISGLTKEFKPSMPVLMDVTTCIPQNDITVIIGKNGSGKSTLLNCVAGIIQFEKGRIEVNISDIKYDLESGNKSYIPANIRKQIGYIFQQKALWNHLTILQNITHPLIKVHGISEKQAREKAEEYLSLLKLKQEYLKKYPGEISGGEQRKVAIARTLAIEPILLLIDELEANLDQSALKLTLDIIKTKFIDTNKTVLIISHSIDLLEQFTPQILLLHEGEIIENAKGIKELLSKESVSIEKTKIIKESVDSSSSRWFFANQSTEAAIRISEMNLEEKNINVLFTKIGSEISKLITKFDPENEHLMMIATKYKTGSSEADIKIRSAEKTTNFILDGNETSKLVGIITRPVANQGVAVYSFIDNHNQHLQTNCGIRLGKKASIKSSDHDSLIDLMFDSNGKGLYYKYSERHSEIPGAYNIQVPIDEHRYLERNSYYEFSKKTKNVYLIGCVVNNEVKGIISIDTYSENKWSDFIIQQIILIGNMVAIAIKNHE